jgi:colicin import membrane protein
MGFGISFGGGTRVTKSYSSSYSRKPYVSPQKQAEYDSIERGKREVAAEAARQAAEKQAATVAAAAAAAAAEAERVRVAQEQKKAADAKAAADADQQGLMLKRKKGGPKKNIMTSPLGLSNTANMVRQTLGGM